MTRRLAGWAAAVVSCALVSSCRSTPVESLRLGINSTPGAALVLLSRDHGAFEREHLRVELHKFISGREALDAVQAGELDVALCYATPLVKSVLAGKRLAVLTMLHQSDRGTALLTRGDRGLRTAQQLAGKRIGVPAGTSAEFFLQVFLVGEGIDVEQVTVVALHPEQAGQALLRGEVDAAAIWHPWLDLAAAELTAAGGEPVMLYSDAYVEASVLATTPEFVQRHPEALRRLIAALHSAESAARVSPEAAAASLAREFSVDRAITAKMVETSHLGVGLDNALLSMMEDEARSIAGGPVPPMAEVLEPGPLRQVEPEAVTVLGID